MALQGEFEYYSTRSGLPAGTLADHKLAFFKLTSGVGSGSRKDHELAYYQVANADTSPDLAYQQYKYFSTKVGHGGSLTDVMRDFFLAPPSGGKPQHRVWATAAPATSQANDALPIRYASSFYVVGVTGWKVVGGRVWANTTGQTFSGWNGQLWLPGTQASNLTGTPAQSVALTPPGSGKSYADFALSPVVMTAAQPYWIGVESPGDYYYNAGMSTSFIQADDAAPLYLSSTSEVGFSRSIYSYTGGGQGGSSAWFGVDILVEEP